MIVFISSKGTAEFVTPSSVYQGSALTNSLVVFAPFPQTVSAMVSFTLPNGNATTRYALTSIPSCDELEKISEESGTKLSVWEWQTSNAEITAYPGIVTAQFEFAWNNEILATSPISFSVIGGSVHLPDEVPTANQWEEMVSITSNISGRISALEERDARVYMIDFEIDEKTGLGKKSFSNGTTLTFSVPTASVPTTAENLIKIFEFNDSIFDPWQYNIYTGANFIVYKSNSKDAIVLLQKYIQTKKVQNEYDNYAYSSGGYEFASESVFVGSNGDIILESNTTFTGRFLILDSKAMGKVVSDVKCESNNIAVSFTDGDEKVFSLENKVECRPDLKYAVYATDGDGKDSPIYYAYAAETNTLACRDKNTGALAVGEPTTDNHAVRRIDVKNAIAGLINGAPETLDTLEEIADAMEENKDVVEALDKAIGTKADLDYVDEKLLALNEQVEKNADEINNKLDKSTDDYIVYGTGVNGEYKLLSYAYDATAGTIPFRKANGVVAVGTSTTNAGDDAVNITYLNNRLSSLGDSNSLNLENGLAIYSVIMKGNSNSPETLNSVGPRANGSLVVGRGCSAQEGQCLVAGYDCKASPTYSINEDGTVSNAATGWVAQAFGYGSHTNGNAQMVIGRFNTFTNTNNSDKSLFIVGNGKAAADNNGVELRRNAFEVLDSGKGIKVYDDASNITFQVLKDGRAKVKSAPVEDDDVVRKIDLASINGSSNISLTPITVSYWSQGNDGTYTNVMAGSVQIQQNGVYLVYDKTNGICGCIGVIDGVGLQTFETTIGTCTPYGVAPEWYVLGFTNVKKAFTTHEEVIEFFTNLKLYKMEVTV